MSESTIDTGELRGPTRKPVNTSAGQPGSIHDDATAQRLGFRGGTVAGSIHMDQFPPLLMEAFGPAWFETGSLSLRFRNATTDGEPVTAVAGRATGATSEQVAVRMERDDGLLVAEGTAAVGDPAERPHLESIDLRPSPPEDLALFGDLRPGDPLEAFTGSLPADDERRRGLADRITEPIPWYFGDSPWGGPIANPSAVVQLLWQRSVRPLARHAGGKVGLFGAIQIRHHRGPVLVDRDYDVAGEIVAIGRSPKTEYVWFDTRASDADGVVASMRMQLRWMTNG